MNRIALALIIAAISTGAAAQSSKKPTWDDLLKPYEAKTNPAVPIAPPQSAATFVQSLAPLSWMDECVLDAVAQLPLPVAPGALRRVRELCAAQSIWQEK